MDAWGPPTKVFVSLFIMLISLEGKEVLSQVGFVSEELFSPGQTKTAIEPRRVVVACRPLYLISAAMACAISSSNRTERDRLSNSQPESLSGLEKLQEAGGFHIQEKRSSLDTHCFLLYNNRTVISYNFVRTQSRNEEYMQYSRGYLLGRLLALLARQEALEATPEQAYQLASSAPPQVFPKALATLIAAGKEENILHLMTLLPLNTFDSGLNRREQGAFALGYFHERAGYQLPLEDEEEDAELETELTERYELRVEPGLKEWMKANGGGAFVRAVLRAERVKQVQPQEKAHEIIQES